MQNGGDLRLLSRLSDLNGQIPSPLSQTFLTHDDDGHHGDGDHDVGHHDYDNEAKIIQLWQDPWFDLRQKIGIKATASINWTSWLLLVAGIISQHKWMVSWSW